MTLDGEVAITVLTAYGDQEILGIHVKSMRSKIRNTYKFEKIIFYLRCC